VDLAVDCDGDALLVTADPAGPTCHRGTQSCFDPADAADAAPADAADAPASSRSIGAAHTAADSPAVGAAPRRFPEPADRTTQGFDWLETLWSTIAARAAERPNGSYTTSLLGGGVDAVGRKVTEEATELLLAAKDDATARTPATRKALAAEAADLLYHALVLLAERELAPAAVIDTLKRRHSP
jgi:phosphoribosyl-ATP pyrophosphohydrolase/phosphoribosyl-AMP cyclohydrolase